MILQIWGCSILFRRIDFNGSSFHGKIFLWKEPFGHQTWVCITQSLIVVSSS
ncbi:hypothetical protein Hanom_Chr13g01213381 [Helianthus anomalus]